MRQIKKGGVVYPFVAQTFSVPWAIVNHPKGMCVSSIDGHAHTTCSQNNDRGRRQNVTSFGPLCALPHLLRRRGGPLPSCGVCHGACPPGVFLLHCTRFAGTGAVGLAATHGQCIRPPEEAPAMDSPFCGRPRSRSRRHNVSQSPVCVALVAPSHMLCFFFLQPHPTTRHKSCSGIHLEGC